MKTACVADSRQKRWLSINNQLSDLQASYSTKSNEVHYYIANKGISFPTKVGFVRHTLKNSLEHARASNAGPDYYYENVGSLF